jgi:2-oxoglutarate dehydrogenase E1 component
MSQQAELVWAQEEPHNMGAFFYTLPRIQSTVRQLCANIISNHKSGVVQVKYAGRAPAASPAAGYSSDHEKQQKQLVHDAFHL